jgi:hypothetical protein
MGGRDLGSDPRFAFGHNGEKEADHVNAALEEPGRHPRGESGVAEHHGNNGMHPWQEDQSRLCHFRTEEDGVGAETMKQVVGCSEQIERFDRGGGDDGGK